MLDLKQLRLDKNLRQDDLADLIGMSRVSISKYESGKDRSKHLEKKILEILPYAKEYIIDDLESAEVLKSKLDEALEKLESYDEKMAHLEKERSSLIRSNEALTRLLEKLEGEK